MEEITLTAQPRTVTGKQVRQMRRAGQIPAVLYGHRTAPLSVQVSERELGLVISRLHSLPLERSRPLWECTLIEGLQPDRFAIYMKIHHSLVDGVGLMQRLTHILAESPRVPGRVTGRDQPPK